MSKDRKEDNRKIVAQNKKAFHDFFIIEKYEAGIVLKGNEVKSLREHKVNLKDSYARIKNDELFLYNMHISPYSKSRIEETQPYRTRKLLMHKNQISKLSGKLNDKSTTLVPLNVYFANHIAKVELALVKAKLKYDKRDDLEKKTQEREIQRTLKSFNR
ncbi:MAG: SsrA-binding protein SmpB [Actinomycetota bacterium]|jgi:SsrA-binding protein|nr:SsrA-binding protein SmpB [Actinomycetota bacterium]